MCLLVLYQSTRSVNARPTQVNLDFTHDQPEFSLLVSLTTLLSSDNSCLQATIGTECNLPTKCEPIYRYHLRLNLEDVLICVGAHKTRGSGNMVQIFNAYPLDAKQEFVPKELYFVDVTSIEKRYLYSLILPRATLLQLVTKYEPPHSFYVNSKMEVCARGNHLPALSTFLLRKLPTKVRYQVSSQFAPFAVKDENFDPSLCDGNTYLRPSCRELIKLNSSIAVCSNAWVEYPYAEMCPTNREYRHNAYSYNDICVNISRAPQPKRPDLSDGWLQKSLKSVVIWLMQLVDEFVSFLEKCVTKILSILFEILLDQIGKLDGYIEMVDTRYFVFEILLVVFFITYRSNFHAALIFVVIYGLSFGYERSGDFRLLDFLRSFTSNA